MYRAQAIEKMLPLDLDMLGSWRGYIDGWAGPVSIFCWKSIIASSDPKFEGRYSLR